MTKQVFTVCARRWFDKVNGNSYYSLRIVTPEPYELVGNKYDHFVVPMSYGHGYATYIADATDFARRYGFDVDNAKFVVDETQVMRKKDLHHKGNW